MRQQRKKKNTPVLRHHTPTVSFTFKLLTSATALHSLGLPLFVIIVSNSLSLALCHPTHSPGVSSIFCSVRETWLCFILQAVYL